MKQSKIAITGGIGSGKSTACRILREEGFPVFSCDEAYAELFDSGSFDKCFAELFGEGVFDADGRPNRQKISKIVFSDREKLNALNKITHPKIFEYMFSKAQKKCAEVCFFEVPLLFEGGYESLFDKVLVIIRDENERIKSIMQRDNLSRSEAVLRIKSQFNYTNKDLAEYYVIHNSGKIGDLCEDLKEFLKKL